MNLSPMISLIWRALRDAAWAPILVIVFRGVAMVLGIRAQLDHVIHFSGGFAIAYFLYRVCKMAHHYIGELSPLARYLMAYFSACTVALFWEFGEFASDIFMRTQIQHSVTETLLDLIYGASGAFLCLLLIAIVERVKRKSAAEQGAAANPYPLRS